MSQYLISVVILHGMIASTGCLRAENLSPVAEPPDWNEVETFQETLTRAEFVRLLDDVYAPKGAAHGLIEVREDRASIVRTLGRPDYVEVRFARSAEEARKPPRYWRSRQELGPAPPEQPFRGMRIALDPGHIGGEWARMEGRWFRMGESAPVMEGSLTLATAEHLAKRLTALGAEVLWVRRATAPKTESRPADFFPLARNILTTQGIANPQTTYQTFEDGRRGETVQFQAELLFYRMSEIRRRAAIVNTVLKPDLTLCLHFNAAAWGRDAAPTFVSENHFHVLVNGCYSASELRFDDQRYDLTLRLFGGITDEEQRLARHVAGFFAKRTALPPFIYRGESARQVDRNPYLWARNLLANRLYRCPVIYLEPYVMNSREIWDRVQAGDYEGDQLVAGSLRPSLCKEYADAVAAGLASAMR